MHAFRVVIAVIEGPVGLTHRSHNVFSSEALITGFDFSRNVYTAFKSRGALGYFLGGYVPPGTPNWHPVLKKISPKIDTPFKKWANFSYPVLKFVLKLIPRSRNGPFSVLESL